MASQKTKVIEYLFNKFWDPSSNSLMTLSDVKSAIQDCNRNHGTNLSDNNPANFMKDFLRGNNSSRNWPATVAAQRYTALQRTGSGGVFEFVRYAPGQTEAFPDLFPINLAAP
ncbi:hypothetical protein [Roseobacter weihaiensis]|uniref:hypothetical protein n=1 Tax=Roseobacter weihaiensis TaxID=2763262 RepID=UPI001D0A1F44|nr:hypothetical protein [Roseobacter sp. H9]